MQTIRFLKNMCRTREVELFGIRLYACPHNLFILSQETCFLIGLILAWIYFVEPQLESHRPAEYVFNMFNCSFMIFFLYIAYIQL